MHTILHSMKTHPRFNQTELTQILITTVLAGFYLSFDNWGVTELDYLIGLQNFLGATAAIFLILTTVIIAQKVLGAAFGYLIEYEYSWAGLVVGFFLTAFTFGAIPLFLPGGIKYQLIKHRRLGQFDPGYKQMEMFCVAALSTIIAILYTLIFGSLYVSTQSAIFKHLTLAALVFAAFSLIPAPNLKPLGKWNMRGVSDFSFMKKVQGGSYGYDMIAFGRSAYYFLVIYTIMFAGLVLLFQTFSLILAAIFVVLLLIIYKMTVSYWR